MARYQHTHKTTNQCITIKTPNKMNNKGFTIIIEDEGDVLAMQTSCPTNFEECEERAKELLLAWTQNYPCAESCIYNADEWICKVLFVDCFNEISSKVTYEYDGTTELSEREEDRYNDIYERTKWSAGNCYKIDPNETDFDWLKP